LQAAGSRASIQPLVQLLQSGKVTGDRADSVLSLIAAVGGPAELGMVLDRVLAKDGITPAQQANLLGALQEASRQRGVRPAGDLGRIEQLLAIDNDPLRAAVVRIAGFWKLESLKPRILEIVRADATSDLVRQAAFESLVQLGDKSSQEAIAGLIGEGRSGSIRRMALIALTALNLDAAAQRAPDVLAATEANADPTDVFMAFLQRKNGGVVLTAALGERKLPADIAKIGVRAVRASGREAPHLIEKLTRAGSLSALPKQLSAQEMQQLVADILKKGDAARGETVYRRKDQACTKCHAIAGAGGQVGPDLASIGASAPVDYLLESILLPNKVIKENYHSLIVTTRKGLLHTGIKVRETKTELVLRDAEDREIAIPIAEIDERANGGSLMPEGLADPLTRGELIDLVRFLSELGKVGPYAISQARLVRRWQVLEATPQARQLLNRTRLASAAGNDPALSWMPAYSQVSGQLPLDAVPRLQYRGDMPPVGLVRCHFDVSTGGKVRLLLNSPVGMTLWLDGSPVEASATMSLDMTAGVHTITIAIDANRRQEGLRCELEDEPGSAARVRIVGGK
jgi:putative heme-binding domain-containing protein